MAIFTKYSPLALAVATLLSVPAFADDSETETNHANLGTLKVTFDRQGAKVKTNVVTTAIKDESTATDLRGLLKGEPSIDFSGGNGTSSYLTIRGMGQNSVDVKVDNAYSDTQILYHQGRHMLDPSLVKIVSVQKGAGGASAGIGQTNGAIVAKTVDAQDLLKGSDKDWGLKVNGGYSDNKETSYGITGFGKASGFDFLLSYQQIDQKNYKASSKFARLTDNPEITSDDAPVQYRSPETGANGENQFVVPYSALDKTNYLAKAGYTFGDHRFVLSHFNTTNKGTRNIREEFNVFDGQDPQYRKLSLENTNLEYKGKGFADTMIEANVYRMKNTRESADDTKSGYAGNYDGKNTTYVTTTGTNIGFDNQIGDNTTFKYGINYRHQEVVPNRLKEGLHRQEKTDTGVYAEVIRDIGNFTLTGGMRYDHFDFKAIDGKQVSNGAINPSVGIIWQATPALSFNATHNHATRSPRPYDALTAHGWRNNSALSIEDNIKAEKAKNTEVGFNFTHGNFSADGSYFWQEINNLLNSAPAGRHPGANINYSKIANVGYAKNRGYELNARYKYNNFTARVGVSDAKPEFYTTLTDGSNPIGSFANREYGNRIGRTYTAGLAYRFAKPNLEIGANYRKVGDIVGQSAWMHHNTTGTNTRNHHRLNLKKFGYNVTDVYVNYKPFNNDKLNINFAINNATNEYYVSHTSGGLPAAGREFRVGFNYTY